MKTIWIVAFLMLTGSQVHAEWMPPKDPDPSVILNEARDDAYAGRDQEALEKHIWFHRNALSYEKALYGVRLSFALSYWVELGKKYPPALAALETVRDEDESRIRSGSGGREDFHDFTSINEYLGDLQKTARLFMWLDENRVDLARQTYDVAERALIHEQSYALCGKYIDSSQSLRQLINGYQTSMNMGAKSSRAREAREEFAQMRFSNSATTLVALLAINNRLDEADQVIEASLEEWPDEGFQESLEKARRGVVPDLWPPLP